MACEFITYEEFGAVGDGVTDDLPAIIAAHEAANERGLPVKARAGAVYYTGTTPRTATIKTDVDWSGATFIADHRDPTSARYPVFRVESNLAPFPLELKSLSREQRSLGVTLPCDLFVKVQDDSVRRYIRSGSSANAGGPQTDCFVVGANGEIRSTLMWDFQRFSLIVANPIPKSTLVIRGGTLRSIASVGETDADGNRVSLRRYSSRNLVIARSNTTLVDFTDEIVGEGEYGAPYSGAVCINNAAYVTVKDCRFMGRRYYTIGSYALNLSSSAFVTLNGIRQTNDIMDRSLWGMMGSNFCKDLLLTDCVMSRFDAHQGVTNCTIRDCTLGWMCLNAIGYGHFSLERVHSRGGSLFNLRRDYGCMWNGTLTVKDCVWTPLRAEASVVAAYNDGTHDFGYPCMMPREIEIDGLLIDDSAFSDEKPPFYVLPNYDSNADGGKKLYPYVPTERLSLRRLRRASGKAVTITASPTLYPNLKLKTEE